MIRSIFRFLRFEFWTLRFCRCLTCLKQDVLYGLLYAALHKSAWQVWLLMISFLPILVHYWAAFVVYQQNWVNITTWISLANIFFVNHIQIGSLRGCSRIGMQKCPPPLPKICHTYPTMMKFNTVITYLTKIQNIYKSRDI